MYKTSPDLAVCRDPSSRRTPGAALTGCVIEPLERRALLSVSVASDGFGDPEDRAGVQDHTLTEAQLEERGWVELPWQGRMIYAGRGEWLLGLKKEPAEFDANGRLIDLNVEWVGPGTPAPELQALLDQAGLGLQFKEFLGARHTVMIDVPLDVDYATLDAALRRVLPDYDFVEPNAVGYVVTAVPAPPTVGQPAGGDVAVSVSRGGLSLRGDNAANEVAVAAGAAPGEFIVSAQPGTTLNGQAGPVTLAGVTRGLRARLGAGDDRLNVTAPALPGQVTLDLGRGADTLTLAGTAIGRNLTVRGAGGAKALDLRHTTVAGRTTLATGSDADAVNLVESTFTGRASIKTGGGDDAIRGTAVFAAGRTINDGLGDDALTLVEATFP